MTLANDKPFIRYDLEDKNKKNKPISVRLNKDERRNLDRDKKILQQEKDSTAFKQLAEIGSIVIHQPEMAKIIGVCLNNYRKNKRLGIVTFEQD